MELLGLPLRMFRLDRPGAEHMLGLHDQLLLPVLDLIRVHIELLGQVGHRPLAADGRQRHLRLKGWGMIASFPLRHLLPLPC